MPAIRVEYDDRIMSEAQAEAVCKALQEAVISTGFENVFVYGNTSEIKINTAPIKAWIEVSSHKVNDRDALALAIRTWLQAWRERTEFPHPINLAVIPMGWKLELEI